MSVPGFIITEICSAHEMLEGGTFTAQLVERCQEKLEFNFRSEYK